MDVFESPIDLLSYWSGKKEKVQDTRMVSIGNLKMEALNEQQLCRGKGIYG
ncbi:toprim domain-containing protein [Bacillus sp. FJAT-44742]|uniref:toprim domain-containing protein n=1 Tax=Bacillus sp. FJAT-44742 TaxID=2014005 RepID=UPI0012FE9864|nr:toprim domain-containing protein [Bacillus sp. FJAT-44742]